MASRSRLSSYWFPVLAAICLFAIAANLWRKSTRALHAERIVVPKAVLKVGDTVPQLQVKTTAGRMLPLVSSDFTFILYYGEARPKDLQKAIYAGFLAKRNHNLKVSFRLVTGGAFAEYEELQSGGMFADLVEDTSSQVANDLAIEKTDNVSLILDDHGTIIFRVPVSLEPEDVRQLYERYANGTIDYSNGAHVSADLVGKRFPQFSLLTDLASNKSIPVSQVISSTREYWIFTANCPVCSLPSFLSHLSKYSAQRNIVPIFSSRLPIPVLRQVAADNKYNGPIYVAEGEMSGLEDIYSNSSFADYIAIIRMADSGLITSAFSVTPFDLDEKIKQP